LITRGATLSMKILREILFVLVASCCFPLFSQNLNIEEKALYDLIMEYRRANGLAPIPLSNSLCLVAQTHVRDLFLNRPSNGNCNLHSWSNSGLWTSCCYTDDHAEAQCMWSKPRELTSYRGNGYEIACGSGGELSAEASLALWKSSPGHNAVIVNQGIWGNNNWQAIGIGLDNGFGVVWFGEEFDDSRNLNLSESEWQNPQSTFEPIDNQQKSNLSEQSNLILEQNNSARPTIPGAVTKVEVARRVNDKTHFERRQEHETAIVLISGLEVWTKFNNSPILPRLKQWNSLDFTGGSPSFWMKSTLPRAKSKNLSDVRLFLALGVTLNNSARQLDLLNQIALAPTALRIYSPLNYEIGLQLFKFFDLGFGRISFGNRSTSEKMDDLNFNRLNLRFTLPLGQQIIIATQFGLCGAGSSLNQWDMASFGISLRSRFN
jgi:hypothetical protein